MKHTSVSAFAAKHNIPERTVRNWCAEGKLPGAYLNGKTWNIPEDAEVPERRKAKALSPLLERIFSEREAGMTGGIYHRIQVDFAYNSNHMEGSRLTHDQTRYIYETNTVGIEDSAVSVDDVIETVNHFRCVDYILDHVNERLTESMVKKLHSLLKSGTSQSRKSWFKVGEYKALPNEAGNGDTCPPEMVASEMRKLLKEYYSLERRGFEEILDFHHRFERIHPFQDGNGRVGRLIMFKECLANGVVPFIITDDLKMFYYRGLANWTKIKGYLRDTCLTAQDEFKVLMVKFRV